MKKGLPSFTCLCTLLFLSVQTIYARQVNPMLPAPATNQPAIEKGSKLSSGLKNLLAAQNSASLSPQIAPPAGDTSNNGLNSYFITKENKVLVNITLEAGNNTDTAEWEKRGLEVTAVYGRNVSGFIPYELVPLLESAAGVRYVRPVYQVKSQGRPVLHPALNRFPAGMDPVVSQGDIAERSDIARSKYKVSGKGVKVGILSDSYNSGNLSNPGVADGELPGTETPDGIKDAVEVLQDFYLGGTDEGRAIAEIVHDIAPGAGLAFHTASYGQANFANGILNLADLGCKVIIDDVLYPDEPFFQDGVIAQALNTAKKNGVTCFSAAGNNSNLSYESVYRPSEYAPFQSNFINGTAHNFNAPGDPPSYFQPIRIPTGNLLLASFQWSQPFFSAGGLGAETDMDIFLLDAGGTIVASSVDDNIASGDPVELLGYRNNTASEVFFVAILKYKGPDPARLKYVNFGDDMSFYVPTPAIPGVYAPALVGHPTAEGTIAVAAANYLYSPAFGLNPPQAEYFSSEGGVAQYFDDKGYPITPVIKKKPEITAPDGGNNSFFHADSRQDMDDYPNFFGTSASAGHAAGVAALMIEAQKLKTITPDQIRGVLAAKSIDMDDAGTIGFDAGFDYKTGAGLIQADASVDVVQFPKVYVKNLQVNAVCSDNPAAARNWKIYNPNLFEVKANWLLAGFQQYGTVVLPPGITQVTTATGYYNNQEVPNIVVMEWEDNFGFPHLGIAVSTKSDCSNQQAAANNGPYQPQPADRETVKPNVAAAYPNPFQANFTVYLSVAGAQPVNLELYGVDGKQLARKTVPAEGVTTFNAQQYKPGVYYLKATGKNFSKTIQLVKL